MEFVTENLQEPCEMSLWGVRWSPWPSVVPIGWPLPVENEISKPLCNGIYGFDSTVMGECALIYMDPTMKIYIYIYIYIYRNVGDYMHHHTYSMHIC